MANASTRNIFILVEMVIVCYHLNPMAVSATEHRVGGTVGWTTNFDYKAWAAAQTISIGDTLEFNFEKTHTLLEVNKNDYESCSTGTGTNEHRIGPVKIKLNDTSTRYFICGESGHCSQGMKIAVTAVTGKTPTATTPPGNSKSKSSSAGAISKAAFVGWCCLIAVLLIHFP